MNHNIEKCHWIAVVSLQFIIIIIIMITTVFINCYSYFIVKISCKQLSLDKISSLALFDHNC